MALGGSQVTRLDFISIYEHLMNEAGLPDEAVSFISVISNELFMPDMIKHRLEIQYKALEEHIIKHPDIDHKKDLIRLSFLDELIKILFSGIEEAPIQINGIFESIAKIRLEKCLL